MRLELDDFSVLQQTDQEKEDTKEQSPQEIERFYKEKILKLEQEYKTLIDQVSKDSYQKGYEVAKSEYEKRLNEEMEKLKQNYEQKQQERMEHLAKALHHTNEQMKEEYRHFIDTLAHNFSEYVASILEYLYISEKNVPFVKEKIEDILERFHNYFPLVIEVSPTLYERMESMAVEGIEIKENKNFEENNFRIYFHDFQIESELKKKLDVIKDEIEQEIANASAISRQG